MPYRGRHAKQVPNRAPTYKKKAPVADFEAVQRRCAIGKRILRKQPVPCKRSGRMQATIALKSGVRKGWVEAVGGAIKE
eukprot:971095-Prymnesium_polylepis.1